MTTALCWMLYLMARHQEVQRRVQAEITEVLGERLPCVRDRAALPFTNAVLNEVLRFGSVVPIFAYDLQEPIEYEGFEMPERTIVFVNMHDVLYDARVWPAPDRFDPDANFPLDTSQTKEDGDTNNNCSPNCSSVTAAVNSSSHSRLEYLTPFGCGRRVLLGESLPRGRSSSCSLWAFCSASLCARTRRTHCRRST